MAKSTKNPTRFYYRHKTKGTIFNPVDLHAKNASLEKVTEMEAYPERFAPPSLKKFKSKVSLDTIDTGPAKPKRKKTTTALGAEASKGMPK